MDIPKIKRVGHVVLYVRDPETSAAWYCKVLGMQVSARVAEGPYAGGIFLSFGTHDHDIAVFPGGEDVPKGREFEHIGLEVDCDGSVEKLQRLYGVLVENGVRIADVLDHGVSKGIYFYDPDGHMLEIFVQLTPTENGMAIAELRENGGQADPIPLDPISG